MCACVTDVRQSPTKRRTMFGPVALATAAVVGRKKSSTVPATTDTADSIPPSVLVVDRPVTVSLGQCTRSVYYTLCL